MPRKSIPKSADVDVAIESIETYCASTDTSINALAEQVGVCQSALWRFMGGQRKNITDSAQKTLEYINNRHNCHNHPQPQEKYADLDSGYLQIENAVRFIWDENPKTAELVASLIRTLKPILDLMVSTTNPGSIQKSDTNEHA